MTLSIVDENTLNRTATETWDNLGLNPAGDPRDVWDAAATRDETNHTLIEGFATDISVNHGQQIDFKINVNADIGEDVPYHIEIYRLGYYGGDGATLVHQSGPLVGHAQPDAIMDQTTGMTSATNWAVSTGWNVPADATSGVYLVKLVRDDNGATNQIPFIVRDDDAAHKSDIVLQTSDTTWQAYNGWGGNNGEVAGNFYGDPSGTINHPDVADPGLGAQDRAYAVSYDRPFITRDGGGAASGSQDYLFGADYAAIYFLEKNGYDVSYISGVDTDRLGADYLIGHKAYISVGHDEYWSGDQRANVEEARDAGVSLLFWSGNECYWKTRLEAGPDGTADRTLVCYKETWANGNPNDGPAQYANIDPANDWTGTWRDMRFVDAILRDANGNPIVDDNGNYTYIAGGARLDPISGMMSTCGCYLTGAGPENAMTGQLFGPDGTGQAGAALDVAGAMAGLRVWRDTTVAETGVLHVPGILGYEWDTSPDDAFRPDGLIKLSESDDVPWNAIVTDQGNHESAGVATHNLSLYRTESGAFVFGSGTVFWSWGLSDQHDTPFQGADENLALKQFTLNMFADMGIQPGVADDILASQGLVRALQSTDQTAPTTGISITGNPTEVTEGQIVTIHGNASDLGGLVAGVEVSTDGGATWHPANGTANWTYSWHAHGLGSHTILARAVDDSVNLQKTNIQSVELNIMPSPDSRIFSDTDTPAGFSPGDEPNVELGVKFQTSTSGFITSLMFYKAPGETSGHEGHLWAANGTLLLTVTFDSESASGWQTAILDTPFAVSADTTYIASYHADVFYSFSGGYFTSSSHGEGSVTALANGIDGPNGVYHYYEIPTDPPPFPTDTFNASNYWVDVSFNAFVGPNSAPEITSGNGDTATASIAENTTAVTTVVASDPDAGQNPIFSIVLPAPENGAGADAALFHIDPHTGVLTFINAPDFEAQADFDHDNVYQVTVQASDSLEPNTLFDQQTISVTVTNEFEPVSIGFDGKMVHAEWLFDTANDGEPIATLGTPQNVLVVNGVGPELDDFPGASGDTGTHGLADIDIESTQIKFTFNVDGGGFIDFSERAFNGLRLTDLHGTDELRAITGVTVSQMTGFLDNVLEAGDIQFTADSIYVYVGGESRTNGATLILNVTFANETPVITSNGGGDTATINVDENATAVTTITASDVDAVDIKFFSIVPGGEDNLLFHINSETGVLTLNAPLDFENLPADGATAGYQVLVQVEDGYGGTDTQLITVNLTDVNDNAPVITTAATQSVAEGQTLVAALTSTDLDTVGTNPASFSITGGTDQALFGISGGNLVFLAAKDYETQAHSYQVQVTANDGTNTTNKTITVNLTDVNDNAPVITTAATQSVAEGQTLVAALTSTDLDTVGTNPASFSITGGTDQALFGISGGNLVFLAAKDYETQAHSYQVQVTANDGTNTTNKTITVNLTDVNDNAPVITTAATQSVAEGQTLVAALTSTDLDTVGTNPASFSITGGTDQALFGISGGNLVFLAAKDYETQAHSYQVQVTANDGTNTTNKTITVNLTDVNDNAPVITTAATQSVAEGQTLVAALTSTDLDTVGTNPASFSITGGTDQALFGISGGNLVFLAAKDYETQAHSYQVQVTANDGTNTTNKTITVNLTDVNDNAPVITTAATQSVAEGQTLVAALTSTDLDTVGTNPASFSITGGTDQALFGISGGNLVFLAAKDYETQAHSYQVQVTANDGTNTTNKTITVNLTDVNDNAPVITTAATQSVAEGQTLVAALTSTDLDTVGTNPASFSITGGTDQALFGISGGNLVFLAAKDYETQAHSYQVQVTANDGTNTTNKTITVNLTDVNDNAPVITTAATQSVAEGQTLVAALTSTDLDTVGTNPASFSITGGTDQALFGISGGNLVFLAAKDYETQAHSYQVQVTANDGTNTTNKTITVNLTDVNDNAPVITTAATQSVAEGQTLVAALTSTDLDTVGTNPASFSITGGTDQALFGISGGNLVFLAAKDYETQAHSYQVQVTANDGTNTTNKTITVNLTDVNDNAPVITTAATQSVAEGQTLVAALTSTDLDTVGTNPASFSITGGTDQALFGISGGNLVFLAAKDYETQAHSYQVQVTANDGTNTTNKTITVNLTDVNDNAPVITTAATQSVAEGQTLVAALTSTDLDTVGTNPASFSITGGTDQALFGISGGNLVFLAAKDYETQAHSYQVQVTANDGTNTTNKTITVNLTDVNDNAPVITSSATPSVAENSTTVVSLAATDADTVGGPTTFSITGGADSALFQIAADGHTLEFIAAPDFETDPHSYDVQVTASDGTNTTPQNITVTLTTDVNDNAPVITTAATQSVAEGQTLVAALTSTDLDTVGTNPASFSITGGTDQALFGISGGNLVFLAAKDYETQAHSYQVQVTANDGTNTTNKTITVNLTDVNDNAPVITTAATQSVAEGQTLVAALTSTDLDTVGTNPASFSITGGTDQALFGISGGNLVFLAAKDYETQAHSYQVQVTANDGTNTTNKTITVNLTDVNDNAPVITTAATQSVAEGQTLVAALTSTDLDTVGTNPASFSITGGTDQALFGISGGNLVFLAAKDYETQAHSYQVQVTANDGTNTTNKTITVNLTDVNDNAPVITTAATQSVAEGQTLVAALTSTDLDTVGTNPASFSITGGTDQALFGISGGNLVFLAAKDYETQAHSYQVQVTANDGTNTTNKTITVNLTDVNDNAPVITTAATQSVAEGQTLVAALTSTDLDTVGTNPASFSITGGTDQALFGISGGNLVFLAAKDYETQAHSYQVQVTANDGTNTTNKTITVNLTDVNDNAPVITTAATQSVAEGQTLVAALTSTDLDTVGTNPASFSITGGTDQALFGISGGNLVFLAAKDYETQAHSYQVQVTANDGTNTTNKTITVNLTDVNDNAPVITTAATQSVAEGQTLVAALTSTDLDTVGTNPASFSITGGTDQALFGISGGNLVFLAAKDYETQAHSYQVQVTANDGTNTTNKTITVNLTDVNDNAPVITSNGGGPTTSINVAENTTAVTTVAAIDADGTPTYSIFGGADAAKFSINAATGVLAFVSAPDFETPTDTDANNTYEVIVRASDGTLTDDQTITVAVENLKGVIIRGSAKNDIISAGMTVKGQHLPTGEEDTVLGGGGNDRINGLGGNDTIKGGVGDDVLIGGLGVDALLGNAGADKFVFKSLADSSVAAADTIKGFSHNQADKIDLRAIDANTLTAGNQAFHFIGNDHVFTNHAGELRFDVAQHLLQADVDGDGQADFAIHVNVSNLAKGDFIL